MKTALIVDDFFVEREKIRDIIERSGLEITILGECSNGVEALEMLGKVIPDLLLTDIEMPFMDGLELAEKVSEYYPQIEVIFLSHHNRFEYARKAIELEANAYILKPIMREEMLKCLKKVIAEVEIKQKQQQYEKQLQQLMKESKPLLADKFKRDLLLGIYTDLHDIAERLNYLGLVIVDGKFLVLAIEADDYATLAGERSVEQREMFFIQISKIIMQWFWIINID